MELQDLAAGICKLNHLFCDSPLGEFPILEGGTDSSLATGGITDNQVTKRGANEWRVSGRYLLTDANLFDVFNQGVENQVAPGMDTQDVLPKEIESIMDQGLELGGPIIKDRLWIWGAYGELDVLNLVPGGNRDKTQMEKRNNEIGR